MEQSLRLLPLRKQSREGGFAMTIDAETAHELCSEAEYQLFTESRSPLIESLRPGQVESRVIQARELFTLWSQRAESEHVRERKEHGASRTRAHSGYILAEQKSDLFAEILGRFERRLLQLAQGDDPETTRFGEKDTRRVIKPLKQSADTTRKLNRVMQHAREAYDRQQHVGK
jgi:hypothetical protein